MKNSTTQVAAQILVMPVATGRGLAPAPQMQQRSNVASLESARRVRAERVMNVQRETIQTLEWMLREARRGRLNSGVFAEFLHSEDGSLMAVTGSYAAAGARGG